MYFDYDTALECAFDLEALQGSNFFSLLSCEAKAEFSDLDVPLDDVCHYLQTASYSRDPSTSTHFEEFVDDTPSVPTKQSEVHKPKGYFIALPLPARLIGSLTPEERYAKVRRYKEKRARRTWSKKINYGCRKRVADNRLRIKGRFVTKEQAKSISGETYTE
jgi:hypothetical protein